MTRTANFKIKKNITAKVIATNGAVKIKYPKQTIGSGGIFFNPKSNTVPDREILLKQWELVLQGDSLTLVQVK